jgi:hypothetical protein
MSNKANPRFFYYIPEDTNIINFWISPGHYGKSIKSITQSARILADKVPSEIVNAVGGCFDLTEANVEIGASIWDKGVARVHIQVEISKNSPLPSKMAGKILEDAGFCLVSQDFYCF